MRFQGIDEAGMRHQVATWEAPGPRKGLSAWQGKAMCGAKIVSIEAWEPGDRELCEGCLERMGEK